jgi:16S rRNA processing protein RimM
VLEVGRIAKAHGLRGEVLVDLVTNRQERLDPGSVLHTEDGRALEVLTSTPHAGRWIVAFAGVEDRDAADLLRGTVLLAEPIEDPEELWVHMLIGSEVFDLQGRRLAAVTGVIANPASDLLELDTGDLVPLRFITESSPGRVVIDPPLGLLDLPE